MRLCIDPYCEPIARENSDAAITCDRCGCQLLVNDLYTATNLLSDKSGFGIIYELVDSDGRAKVLKVLKPEFNDEQRTVALFQQEAHLLQQLDTPGLPKIEAYIHHELPDGNILHGIIMEKIAGSNLYEWLRSRGHAPIDENTAIAWLRQIVSALDLVHQQNYFHRDIKPSNIMLQPSGKLVLIDFGSARHESLTYLDKLYGKGGITQIASQGYTAPEQERGFAVPQSDFYALGMTFVHLVTGKYPLDMYDPLKNIYNWRSHAPQISQAFTDFLDSTIAIPPIDRPVDCAAILKCLDEIESPATPPIAVTQPVRVPKLWIGAGAVATIAIAYILAVVTQILPAPFAHHNTASHDRECVQTDAAKCQLQKSSKAYATTTP